MGQRNLFCAARTNGLKFLLVSAALFGGIGSTEAEQYVSQFSYPAPGAFSYRYEALSTTLYVESDGIHVSALNVNGKILWTKNLEEFGQYYMPPPTEGMPAMPKKPDPKIIYLGPLQDWARSNAQAKGINHAVGLTFSTSVFGILNVENGKFFLLGQD